ncbi:MAG: hypothetical protein K0Q83_2685 [Deltaproteobacteria bacterium]|nr:hypothetical protein [Deltaproteobacteria bacterium]
MPLEGRNPEALVQGWNRALEAISGSLVSDLKASNVRLERRSTSRAPAFQLGWTQLLYSPEILDGEILAHLQL